MIVHVSENGVCACKNVSVLEICTKYMFSRYDPKIHNITKVKGKFKSRHFRITSAAATPKPFVFLSLEVPENEMRSEGITVTLS